MVACVKEAVSTLGYASLKPEQEKVLSEFLGEKNVFVSLSTGFGKSLCYTALPLAFDLKRFHSIEPNQLIVIVVSPLLLVLTFMKDQDQVRSDLLCQGTFST